MPSPTPFCYSSTQPPTGSNAGVSVDFGTSGPGDATFPINFTAGALNPNGPDAMPSKFTVGGWVRRMPGNAETIFQVQPFFSIGMNSQGQAQAQFANGRPAVVSGRFKIDDGDWHFVGVTFGYPSGASYGILTLYVDGCLGGTDTQVSPATGASTTGQVQLGGTNGLFQFATWAMWSDVVDAVVYGGSEHDESLVGAWDFADGPVGDVSGNSHRATVSGQLWHVPSVSIGPNTALHPDPADGLSPGGGPFTLMCWAYIPGQPPSTYALLASSDGLSALLWQVTFNGVDQPYVAYQLGPAGAGNTVSGRSPLASPMQWTHFALTFDGSQIALYVNGTFVTSSPVPNSGPLMIHTPNVSIGITGNTQPAFFMQAFSVWTQALPEAAIQGYMNGNDPTGEAGCAAFYPLVNDMGNTVTGSSLTPGQMADGPNWTAEITESDLPLASLPAPPPAVPILSRRSLSAANGPAQQKEDIEALAQQNGINVNAVPDAAATAEAAPALAWYEQFLTGVDPQTAESLRTEFAHNLNIGMQLEKRGIGIDTFSAEGNDLVVRQTTPTGVQEVARITFPNPLTPYQTWCVTIATDVIYIVAAMLGLVSSIAAITESQTIEQAILEEFGRIATLSKNANKEKWALDTIWNTIKVLYNQKKWFTIFYKLVKFITGSWWGRFFIVLSLVLQLAAWIATPELLFVVKMAQWAAATWKLIHDLQNPPPNATVV